MAHFNDLFPSKYVSAADLNGREVEAEISHVEIADFDDNDRKVRKPVAYFVGGKKGLVLNKTNSTTISDISGKDDTDDWAGTRVVLYGTMVQFGSKMTEAIRIRAPQPKEPDASAGPPKPLDKSPGSEGPSKDSVSF